MCHSLCQDWATEAEFLLLRSSGYIRRDRQRDKLLKTEIFNSRGKLKEQTGEHMTLPFHLGEDFTNGVTCMVILRVLRTKKNIQTEGTA